MSPISSLLTKFWQANNLPRSDLTSRFRSVACSAKGSSE